MPAYNVHHLPFWRQFNDAIRKRASVVGGGFPEVAPNVGDPLQPAYATGALGVYLIGDLQAWIENNCHLFLRSHNNDGSKRNPATFFNGLTSKAAIEAWSWETLKISKLGGDGWTAPLTKTTHTHRRIQAGDIWQPVIFDELAACFDALLWTMQELLVTTSKGGGGMGADFPEAKSNAVAAFNDCPESGEQTPVCKILSIGGYIFSANLSACKYELQAEVPVASLVNCTAYGYVKATVTPNGSWNDQGQGNIVQNEFRNVGSGSVAIGNTTTIAIVGYLTQPPNWPEYPPPDTTTYEYGWEIESDYFTLVEWGFSLLTPLS